jgi:hypothetical protein
MRATLKIENRTKYRTEDLRAFVVRAREQVFGDERRPLMVRFVPARRYASGHATVNGSRSLVRVPPNVDRFVLAQIIVHELAHNAGARGERWMRRSKQFGFRHPEWRESVAWADGMLLELKPAAPKLTPAEKLERLLTRAEVMRKHWSTRAKRANTALRSWTQRVHRIERRMAALKAAEVAS